MSASNSTIALAITGASGIQYGMRLLECLLAADRRVYVMVSKAARIVARYDTDWKLPGRSVELTRHLTDRLNARPGQLSAFGEEEWSAPVASGSSAPHAMVVCPCTMATLSAIAQGTSRNLIERAADVMLKESRKLIIVPRETPFSVIHLENMLKLARMGVIILPANPGFYERPTRIEQLVDFIVARVLDQLGVEHELGPRWGQS